MSENNLEHLTKLGYPSVKYEMGYGGKPKYTSENVAGALGRIRNRKYASSVSAGRYAYAIELNNINKISIFELSMLHDFVKIKVDRKLPTYGEKYLSRLIGVGIYCQLRSKHAREIVSDTRKAQLCGVSRKTWLKKHYKGIYDSYVIGLFRDYEDMIDEAMREMKRN